MDTCKCIHTFQQSWENTKKLLAESYDLVATKENPLPQSWMRIEIKLGTLQINLEDDKWNKAVVRKEKTNIAELL